MGATAMQSSKLQMVPNKPERFQIKYVNVYPGKERDGKTFAPQVGLKGKHNGADAVCYMNGAVWAAIKALVAGGVIDPGQYDENPTESYSIPVNVEDVTLLREQQAGQKFPEWVIRPADGTAPPPRPAPTPPASHAGPHIAGLDDAAVPINRTMTAPAQGGDAPYVVPQQIVEKYRACMKAAVALTAAEFETKGIACDASTVQAAAATLLIQWSRGA